MHDDKLIIVRLREEPWLWCFCFPTEVLCKLCIARNIPQQKGLKFPEGWLKKPLLLGRYEQFWNYTSSVSCKNTMSPPPPPSKVPHKVTPYNTFQGHLQGMLQIDMNTGGDYNLKS